MPPTSWPVSVKGVVVDGDRVLLARNDRDEWELPGGRLEAGESPEQCVAREVLEETGLVVEVGAVVDVHVFEVVPGNNVLVLGYACVLQSPASDLRGSAEHVDVAFVDLGDLPTLALPAGYRAAIDAVAGRADDQRGG